MYKDFKYALDGMFLFMLFVSIAVFAVNFFVPVGKTVTHTVEYIDFAVLSGYYYVFARGLNRAPRKLAYFKEHWVMFVLLAMPFIPLARIARLMHFEKMFQIGTNTLWHVLDEFGML